MKIKLIDFGGTAPSRAHYNDAGADVFANKDVNIRAHTVGKVPLGIGLELPDGFVALVLPRSGVTTKLNLIAQPVPIDSGYTGEIHAIMHNANKVDLQINKGDKIAQLVIIPTILAEFTFDTGKERGDKGFGSTGIR